MPHLIDPNTGESSVAQGISGAALTFETAAMGYDPSTGRTPVELLNNSYPQLMTNSTVSASVKAAPGFLHSLNLAMTGASANATHLAIYDNTAASGTLLFLAPLPAANTPYVTLTFDAIFNTGLTAILATVSVAGVITPAASVTGMAVFAQFSYR